MNGALDIVFVGLSITSSWGNGHATTYRALVQGLSALGHRVTFLERDVPWYRDNRDAPAIDGCVVHLYRDLKTLQDRFASVVRDADAVIVGSYVPEGCAVGRWVQRTARGVTAFYDIDTPVTLAKLARGDHEYLEPEVIPGYDLYLSFTGGPTLERLERVHGAQRALPLYCSVDAERYRPLRAPESFALGYLGTWSQDRQPKVDALLIDAARALPARRFAIGGPGYPDTARWPENVEHHPHVPPRDHPRFYCEQRFTLNVTRADMVAAGWSPSVRLFEAAACGVPIVSDDWPGLGELFAKGDEVLVASGTDDVLEVLTGTSDAERDRIGSAARARVLAAHTSHHRAAELARYLWSATARGSRATSPEDLVAEGTGQVS